MNHSQIHSAIAGQWPGIAKAARPTPAPSNNLLLDAPEAAALMGISVRLFHKIRPTLPAPVVLSLRAVRWRRSDLEAYISGLQADTSARPEPEQLMRGKAAKRSSRCQLSDAISESKVQSQCRKSNAPSNCEKEAA